eukprot:1144063-Pelagomonas_calceolata.AAC.1
MREKESKKHQNLHSNSSLLSSLTLTTQGDIAPSIFRHNAEIFERAAELVEQKSKLIPASA